MSIVYKANKKTEDCSSVVFSGGDTQNRTGDKGFADLGLTTWLCRRKMERKTRLELATPTLARWCSTTELLPHEVATRRGLEPLTSAVTGRHSNQLNYRAVSGDAYGIRTREAAVKGRCLNHLTNRPQMVIHPRLERGTP